MHRWIINMKSSTPSGVSHVALRAHCVSGALHRSVIVLRCSERKLICEAMKLDTTNTQVGFLPHVHLVTAWNSTEVDDLIRDRLFCERTGNYVSYSNEEHSPEITSLLSIKVSIFPLRRQTLNTVSPSTVSDGMCRYTRLCWLNFASRYIIVQFIV